MVAYPRVSNNKNLPYLLEEMAQWCLFKSRSLETQPHIIFSFFIFMILSVEQMNLDDNMHNKTKKVMLGW